MEGITWLTHRYVMHGFLWYLHEDHHQKGTGFFEKNDAFFVIFAIPSWLCIMLGSMNQLYWVVSIGAGIALYGFAYFVVHEIIIHQRFKTAWSITIANDLNAIERLAGQGTGRTGDHGNNSEVVDEALG